MGNHSVNKIVHPCEAGCLSESRFPVDSSGLSLRVISLVIIQQFALRKQTD